MPDLLELAASPLSRGSYAPALNRSFWRGEWGQTRTEQALADPRLTERGVTVLPGLIARSCGSGVWVPVNVPALSRGGQTFAFHPSLCHDEQHLREGN